MPNHDDTMSPRNAKIAASRVLMGLAKLLESNDPQMRVADQRKAQARFFRRVSKTLLDEENLDYDYVRHADEWAHKLSDLLGIYGQ